jgi:hypothetical protein
VVVGAADTGDTGAAVGVDVDGGGLRVTASLVSYSEQDRPDGPTSAEIPGIGVERLVLFGATTSDGRIRCRKS